MKQYHIPVCEIESCIAADILTISVGEDGNPMSCHFDDLIFS